MARILFDRVITSPGFELNYIKLCNVHEAQSQKGMMAEYSQEGSYRPKDP